MINSSFSSEKRRKQIRASKSRRRLRVELFEQRMMLHGDAMDDHDTRTDMADGVVDADKTINIVFDPFSSDTGYNALVNSVVFAGNQNIDVANVAPNADAGGPSRTRVKSTPAQPPCGRAHCVPESPTLLQAVA